MIPGRIVAVVLAVTALPANVQGKEDILNKAGTAIFAQSIPQKTLAASHSHSHSHSHNVTLLPSLIAEALENNPEIQAAYQEREAAQQRIGPAEALDDPMLEAGVINAPLASSPFNREDMTMKMIGLSQRLPFPGKRGLRKDVAAKDAEAIEQGYHETVNRVVHDLKIAYFDLGLTLEMIKLVKKITNTRTFSAHC